MHPVQRRVREVCSIVTQCSIQLLVVLLWTSALSAQAREHVIEVGAGVAAPTGLMRRDRGFGPLIRIGVMQNKPLARVRVRLDAEALWLSRNNAPPANQYGNLTALSAVYNVLVGPVRTGFRPYALGGIGLQWVHDQTPDTYPGGLAVARIGGGLRGGVGRYTVSLEAASQFAIFSIFGGVGSTKVGAYWPVTLGITF